MLPFCLLVTTGYLVDASGYIVIKSSLNHLEEIKELIGYNFSSVSCIYLPDMKPI